MGFTDRNTLTFFNKHSLLYLQAALIYVKSVVNFTRKPFYGPSIDALKPNNSFQITMELTHLGRVPFSPARPDLNRLKVPIYLQTVSPLYRIMDEHSLSIA